jgi:hypothetical protein
MDCDYQDRHSQCEGIAKTRLTWGSLNEPSHANLCKTCVDIVWEINKANITKGICDWHQTSLPNETSK